MFGDGEGYYDHYGELEFGLMFHGFDYPDETGRDRLAARFWRPKMADGVVQVPAAGRNSRRYEERYPPDESKEVWRITE